MFLRAYVTSVLELTTGFYWSYTVLLKSPVLVRSCSCTQYWFRENAYLLLLVVCSTCL